MSEVTSFTFSNGPISTVPEGRTVNAHEHRSIRLCPLCGWLPRLEDRIHEQYFVGHPRQDIYQCPCGMIFADSGLNHLWYDEYYREHSKYHDYGGVTIFDDPRRHEHTATYLSPFVNKSSRILDFGCASGNLLKTMREYGFSNLSGFDPSSKATSKSDFQIVSSLDGERFDAIVMSHVLEHVYDVPSVMKSVLSALRDNGVFYIEVPDSSRYKAVSPYQEFNIEHVNHFSLASLCSLAGRFGLIPLHVGQKTFGCGDGFDMYAIYGVFRKQPRVDLGSYIRQSEDKLQAINERLDSLPGKVVIWGAGQLTLKLLNLPALQKRSIRLVDTNSAIQGMRLLDQIVASPDTIQSDDVIVIGSILNEKSIYQSILKGGFTNPIVTVSGNLPTEVDR